MGNYQNSRNNKNTNRITHNNSHADYKQKSNEQWRTFIIVIIAFFIFAAMSFIASIRISHIMANENHYKTSFYTNHADGNWRYYYDVHATKSEWPGYTPEHRRSKEVYRTFEECKQALFSHMGEYVIGGCVRDCEIEEGLYAVKFRDCEEVVEFN